MEDTKSASRPLNVTVDKADKRALIDWDDGHTSSYSFDQLRAACPCAECKSFKSDNNPLRQALVVSTGLDTAQLVGNYAIQFVWDDGHRFGIFTWDYLRSLG